MSETFFRFFDATLGIGCALLLLTFAFLVIVAILAAIANTSKKN